MQINHRFHYNFALEYATSWANKLGKPLLILEAFSCDYPWANARTHTFMMQGMKEHLEYALEQKLNYVSFVEEEPGQYMKLLRNTSSKASLLITDEYPVFIMKERNERLPDELNVPYVTVDSTRSTLNDHRDDFREQTYTYEELEQAKTHDEIWNAAQSQLREEGVIHNFLRMLWGKKVIEWTPDPETAMRYLIDLNNTWAIDGRDPNSYSGIFWCFGRFDRAWQERPVFGKVRYMSSDNTRKKVKVAEYLKRFGNNGK